LAETKQVKILVPGHQPMVDLLGHRDELLRIIEERFHSDILVRGNEIMVDGESDEVEAVTKVFEELVYLLDKGQELSARNIKAAIDVATGADTQNPSDLLSKGIAVHRGKTITPRTDGQARYLDAIENSTATFAIGPAGTGKTYLAMAKAVQYLRDKKVNRIILTRPVVEAGEKLGFLPGDLYEKVDPYLRPLYDALLDMMDPDQYQRLMDRGIIEVAPLAYMRGRTLNDSFIILDEAQNTTPAQLKMFLTRIGFGAKLVVTGDITQVDLPKDQVSGLRQVGGIFKNIEDMSFVRLSGKDVVRHDLVQRIIDAYNDFEGEGNKGSDHPLEAEFWDAVGLDEQDD